MTDKDTALPPLNTVKIQPSIVDPVSREEARRRREEQRRIERKKAEDLRNYMQEVADEQAFEKKLRDNVAKGRELQARVKATEERNELITEQNENLARTRKKLLVWGIGIMLAFSILKALSVTLMAGW